MILCCSSLPQPENLSKSQKTAAFLGCMLAPWAVALYHATLLKTILISKKIPILHRPPIYSYVYIYIMHANTYIPRHEWILNLRFIFKYHNNIYKDDRTNKEITAQRKHQNPDT